MPITYHTRRKTHTQPITTTHNKHTSPLPPSKSSCKRARTLTHTPTLSQPTHLTTTQNLPKTPSTHTPIRPQNIQHSLALNPTSNTQQQPVLPIRDVKHARPFCNDQTPTNSTYSNAKLGTHHQPTMPSTHPPSLPYPLPKHSIQTRTPLHSHP